MKTIFLILLALNLTVGAWLWLGGPADTVRESGRIGMQVVPEQFRSLTDADVARLHSQAEKTAAAAAASVSAPAPAPPPAVATSSAVDVPQADCVLVLNLTSESAARKLRWRLAETGLGDRVTVETENQKNRLRATGINAAAEERIHQILKEYPKLELQHCVGAPPVLRARAEER